MEAFLLAASGVGHMSYDPDELVRWAESYGHPEEWAKKAQSLHTMNETLKAERDLLSRALDAAVLRSASTVDDCDCESCVETRRQMRDYFIDEARGA